jgi:hypothetical protein
MIERLQRIATFLARFRLVMIALAGFSALILLLSVVENPWLQGDALLVPAIIALCWALILYSASELFLIIPDRASNEDRFGKRMALQVGRFALGFLGVLTVLCVGAMMILSYQLLRAWL